MNLNPDESIPFEDNEMPILNNLQDLVAAVMCYSRLATVGVMSIHPEGNLNSLRHYVFFVSYGEARVSGYTPSAVFSEFRSWVRFNAPAVAEAAEDALYEERALRDKVADLESEASVLRTTAALAQTTRASIEEALEKKLAQAQERIAELEARMNAAVPIMPDD